MLASEFTALTGSKPIISWLGIRRGMKASKKRKLWVMHSGRDGEAHVGFVEGRISLGWAKCGNLRSILPDRKAFRKHYRAHYPADSPAAARMKAGALYRFLHEMNIQNVVVYPSGNDGLVRFGIVSGPYKYERTAKIHPHRRNIKWFKEIPRSKLPFKIKRALSGRCSLYQPRKYAGDIFRLLSS